VIKKDSIFILTFCSLVFFGCSKKDPEIEIKAGETGGSGVNYVNLDSIYLFDYYLDANNDGVKDFYFGADVQISGTSEYISYTITPVSNDALVYTCVDGKNNLLVLKKGDKIDESLSWMSNKNMCLYFYSYSAYPTYNPLITNGNWININDGYLGFKIIKGSKTYLGWLRLSLVPFRVFYIKDYAYMEINS